MLSIRSIGCSVENSVEPPLWLLTELEDGKLPNAKLAARGKKLTVSFSGEPGHSTADPSRRLGDRLYEMIISGNVEGVRAFVDHICIEYTGQVQKVLDTALIAHQADIAELLLQKGYTTYGLYAEGHLKDHWRAGRWSRSELARLAAYPAFRYFAGISENFFDGQNDLLFVLGTLRDYLDVVIEAHGGDVAEKASELLRYVMGGYSFMSDSDTAQVIIYLRGREAWPNPMMVKRFKRERQGCTMSIAALA